MNRMAIFKDYNMLVKNVNCSSFIKDLQTRIYNDEDTLLNVKSLCLYIDLF